jgi:hypothetical protein
VQKTFDARSNSCHVDQKSKQTNMHTCVHVHVYMNLFFVCPLVGVYMTVVCVYMYKQTDRLGGWISKIVPAHIHIDDTRTCCDSDESEP